MRYLFFLLSLPALAQVHVEACSPTDNGFSGGVCYTSPIALPPGAPAYLQKERYGNFVYHFAVPDGAYRVTLHLIENSTAITGPGQRVFSIMSNGVPAATALDLFASAGYNMPYDVSVAPVSAVGGSGVSITFTSLVRNAVVSAIDITPTVGATCAHFIAKAPIGALLVFRNGILLRENLDYTVSGGIIAPIAWGDNDLMTAYAQWREDWACAGGQSQPASPLVLKVDPAAVPGLWHTTVLNGSREYYLIDWPPK